MISTCVGYSGGTTKNPTYRHLDDHSETIAVDYDPSIIAYEALLQVFWQAHNPAHRPWSRQYMSAIFYRTEEQKELALKTQDSEAARRGEKIYTQILPASTFYKAEDYHQKYYLRQRPELAQVIQSLFPSEDEAMDSTLAARLNGFIGGYIALPTVEHELDGLGVPQAERQRILDALQRSAYGRRRNSVFGLTLDA